MDLVTFRAQVSKRVELLQQAEAEQKTVVEMIKDALANDEELVHLEEKVKEARTRFTAQREAVLNEPANRKQMEKLKDIQQELKDTRMLLSQDLLAYVLDEKKLEFEDSSGGLHRISVTAKMKATDQQSMF